MGYELITNSAGTIAGYIESETGTLTQQQAEDAILCNKENPTDAEKQTAQAALDTFSGYALLRKQRNRLLAETGSLGVSRHAIDDTGTIRLSSSIARHHKHLHITR